MKLRDILDMEEYLKNRCYCPGEIYSSDGFFYQLFDPGEECELLGKNEEIPLYVAVAKPKGSDEDKRRPQILFIFEAEENKVADTVRCDATENNIAQAKRLIKDKDVKIKLDEYEKGATAKALKEVLSIADAVIID